MNKHNVYKTFCLFSSLAIPGIPATAAIYDTTFTGFVQGTDFVKNSNIFYGGVSPGVNFTAAASAQWGITAGGNDFVGDFARPQKNPNTNLRMIGLFLDPSLFAGAGQYTVSFDLTGDTAGNAAYGAYVFSGSGYDLTGTEDKRLSLSLAAPGFPGYTGLSATGTGVVATQLVALDLSTLATTAGTSLVSIDFTYDGSSAIAISIGGYNNASTIDNFTVVPEPATYAMWAGLAMLGLVIYRRRR